MDINRIIGLIFTSFFVLVLFYIILRSLFLMQKDMKNGYDKPEEDTLRLKVIKAGDNRNLKEGLLLNITHETTFGRKNDNTIVLTDPYASGYHFRIFPNEGRFVIEDNKSTNGTLLNGEKLAMKTYLKNDDLITVGNLSIKVIV
ncbi:MAG: FHA domain-containing protein [Clostridiaceae bacterium]